MNINRVIIVGRTTADPDVKQTTTGVKVARFSIATNRIYKNQNGEKLEEVEYHNVVFFGKIAEVIDQYLKKGSLVAVEGRLKTSSWEKDGTKKYKTEIIGESMQLGPKAGGSATASADTNADATTDIPTSNHSGETVDINPDDIPF